MGQRTSPLAWFELDELPSFAYNAWKCIDPMVLAKGKGAAPRRGTAPDVPPNADGVLANPLWLDGAERVLTWNVWGLWDPDGDPYPSTAIGIESNLAYLDEQLEIPADPDSTFSCTLHLPSGATRVGPVQLRDWDWTIQPDHSAIALMRLFLPAGYLPLDTGAP